MVYVASVRPMFLRDRVAPVSTRVCQVTNGQPLQVLQHWRRFLKVETSAKQIGWIEDRATIDQNTYDGFVKLAEENKNTPVAASGTLFDDLAMHLSPGRKTPRFYLVSGNSKVELLARATAPRDSEETPAVPPSAAAAHPAKEVSKAPSKAASRLASAPVRPSADEETAKPPAMDDWWLARDAHGHVGWLLANRIYVDVPDDVAQYAEGQRILGAWVLKKVHDPDPDLPNHEIPEYLMALAAPTNGLPYDYDQLRVFTWSMRHHRYETAFRLHPIAGYLPVRVLTVDTANGPVPAFRFEIANSGSVAVNPETGVTQPASLRTIEYEMVDTRVERMGPDLAPIASLRNPGQQRTEKTRQRHKNRSRH